MQKCFQNGRQPLQNINMAFKRFLPFPFNLIDEGKINQGKGDQGMAYKKAVLSLLLLVVLVFTAACGHSEKTSSGTKAESKKSTDASGSITIGGSTALQPLATAAAKQYQQDHPDAVIEVQGGGSGTGLSEVAKGNFAIGMSDVFAEEKEGIPADQLKDYKVAVVGMTAAINKEAGVTNLSKKDLIAIFTGKVKNWSEVGGKNLKITLVNRPDGSGTLATFQKYALDGAKPAKGITQDASNTVKKIIAETPGAIGYLAFSYFDDSVVKASIDGIEATNENVENGKFPIWAYEHMYTKGEPKGLTKAFLDYMMSDTVQNQLLPSQGYIPITAMKVERDANGNVTKK